MNDRGAVARTLWLALLVALTLVAPAQATHGTRDVLVVGNNWDGTADVVDPRAHKVLTRLNVVPDLAERRAEIARDPVALGFLTPTTCSSARGMRSTSTTPSRRPTAAFSTSRGQASPTSSRWTSARGGSRGA